MAATSIFRRRLNLFTGGDFVCDDISTATFWLRLLILAATSLLGSTIFAIFATFVSVSRGRLFSGATFSFSATFFIGWQFFLRSGTFLAATSLVGREIFGRRLFGGGYFIFSDDSGDDDLLFAANIIFALIKSYNKKSYSSA